MKVALIGGMAHGMSVEISHDLKYIDMQGPLDEHGEVQVHHYRNRLYRCNNFDRDVFVLDGMDHKESLKLFLSTVYGPGL